MSGVEYSNESKMNRFGLILNFMSIQLFSHNHENGIQIFTAQLVSKPRNIGYYLIEKTLFIQYEVDRM